MVIPQASEANLERHLRKLTVDIGVRLAGSSAERAAADYLAAAGSSIPGVKVAVEDFPVWERSVTRESLEVELHGQWHAFECSLFGAAPSTDGATIEAPLVFFDTTTGYQHADLAFLKGKAVVHLGCHLDTPDHYRRLMEAEPAFLLFVDTRFPGSVALADGLFPAYVQAYGARTTVNVAYQDAWRWKREQGSRARLCVAGCRRKSLSENVILEIAGSDREAGVIYVGGHHDTQAGTVGADDNAVGSASVVELARMLSGLHLKRTLRLISFGAEEQLSVGSASYVRRHRDEVARNGCFMFNIDGSGSLLGWLSVNYNGPKSHEDALRTTFGKHDFYFNLKREICPYTDQFPFAVAGVPGLWLTRMNCSSGTFYHHRRDDTLNNLSVAGLAGQLDAVAEFLTVLTEGNPATVNVKLAPEQQAAAERVWEDLCGGWNGFD